MGKFATAAILAASLALTPSVRAFDTPTHDEVTRRITDACGYDSASGQLLNLGNRHADFWDPKDHDGEGQFPPAHADEERFPEASVRIKRLLQKATCQLLACDREGALESLGRTMHPVEDFFAHSNFVEIEQHDQRRYPIDFLNLPAVRAGVTCDPKTHLSNYPGLDGLTSDYFRASDLFWKPPGKCSHREINKDHPNPDTSDTADPAYAAQLHPIAKARAVEEGVKFLRDQAEPKILSALRKVFVPARTSSVSHACTVDGDGLMVDGHFVDELVRLDLFQYLHKGGGCPFVNPGRWQGGYRLDSCPAIDW